MDVFLLRFAVRGILLMRKRCGHCKKNRLVKFFYRDKGRRDGLDVRCKTCVKERNRLYMRSNREARQKYAREWHRRNPGKQHGYHKLCLYGITSIQFKALTIAQQHRCAVCRKRKKLCVDHCHKTGVVRMLLCTQCNLALGHLYDDPKLLERAAKLLRNPPAQKIITKVA